MVKSAIILLLSVALGACTLQGPAADVAVATGASAASAFAREPQPAAASDRRALVRLPEAAGRIERVHVDRFANGYRQTIAFGATVPGLASNQIDIRLRAAANAAAVERLAIDPPTEAMIREELAALFPRMEMRVVDRPRRNAAGVYGLAAGRWENGTRCIYAWQWIDNPVRTEASTYDAASIRIRLCRRDGALDQLAGLVDDLLISPAPEREADVPPAPAVKPHAGAARHVRAGSQPGAAEILRRREWHDATLRHPTPVVPTAERSGGTSAATLDPTLPAAAFRGPSAETRTANR